jgi:hypothetical protein
VSIEELIGGALSGFADGHVYATVADPAIAPYIVYHQVGGDAVNYVEPAVPNLQNARIQINVWAKRRMEASALAQEVENAMRLAAGLQTKVLGAKLWTYDPETKLHGTTQDFSIWVPNE